MSLFSKLSGVRPPVRRVLAVDAGSRSMKLLLAESDFGRLRLLNQELIDLQAEGLVAAEELKTHLQVALEDWGRPPLALVLPQHQTVSQVVDLPLAPESEVEKLIQDETLKGGGVSDSRIVYDFVRIETPAKSRQQFWVTWSQEGDIRERIARLGIEREDICEVTTTANALIAAYRAADPASDRAILVHLGAQTTVVVVLLAGQGAFATSFQMGGDFFTRSLARLRQLPEDRAEALKGATDLLSGPEAVPEFAAVVDGWVAELKRQLHEWFQHRPGLAAELRSFEWVASGGAFDQPGLLRYLEAKAGLALHPWPRVDQPDMAAPPERFEIAFGAALQALGHSAQPVSLLPDEQRAAWRKRQLQQHLDLVTAALLIVCLLALALGTWHTMTLNTRKQALLDKVRAGQATVEDTEALTADLLADYEAFRPVFAVQQNTLDTLKTLNLLEQSRSNRTFWYVLVCDQQSYFSPPSALGSTNKPPKPNPAAPERPRSFLPDHGGFAGGSTNVSPAKPGLIAELCVPEDAEGARRVLSQLINDLKRQPLFSKADLLSEDLRRSVADPKVVLPDRHYALALDFAQADFQQPVHPKKPASGAASPTGSKRPPRSSWTSPEPAESPAPPVP